MKKRVKGGLDRRLALRRWKREQRHIQAMVRKIEKIQAEKKAND